MYPLATKPGFNSWKWVGGLLLAILVVVVGFTFLRPAETPFTRAVGLIRAGKAAAALPILEELSRKQPDDNSVFPWLAQAYLSTERLGEGRTALDTAIRTRQPTSALLPVVLAYTTYYAKKGDFEEAEKLLDSAAALKKSDLVEGRADLYLAWAEQEARSGGLDAAIGRLDKAVNLLPELTEAKRHLVSHRLSEYLRQQAAIAELKKKNDREAIVLLQKSLAVADEPATRMALANLFRKHGKLADAIDNYRRVSSADPNNLEARHRLIDLLVESKDYRTAREALTELTDKERSVENYQLLAFLHLKLDNPAGAVRAYEDASGLRPKDPVLLAQLEKALRLWSDLLTRQGKLQESMSVKGHADRVAEMLAALTRGTETKGEETPEGEPTKVEPAPASVAVAPVELPPLDPKVPPVTVCSARIWLARGSLTPEGEIGIKNIAGRPVSDLALTVVFYDNTTRKRNGTVVLPVAGPASKPFAAGATRTLYFSCPNIVKPDHQLAVIIFWKGRLLKEFPVVKQR
jgi:tetratricopeptide (TPR) repeat protein